MGQTVPCYHDHFSLSLDHSPLPCPCVVLTLAPGCLAPPTCRRWQVQRDLGLKGKSTVEAPLQGAPALLVGAENTSHPVFSGSRGLSGKAWAAG